MDINEFPLTEFDSLFNAELNKAHINHQDGDFTIYVPVAYRDDHGTVLAHLINSTEDGISVSKYYSRGWGFWNFADHGRSDLFATADEAVNYESYLFYDQDRVDMTINDVNQSIELIKNQQTPHANYEWQKFVVGMAYNAITEDSDFIRIVKDAGLKPFDVQLMVDRAMIQILGNRNFRLEDTVIL